MRVQSIRWKIARRHLNQRRSHRLRWALVLVPTVLLLISGVSGATAMYFVSQLPSISRFHVHYDFQNARIFDSRGDLLFNMADLGPKGGRRVVEPLQARHDAASACRDGVNRIPLTLQNATIATEDATFYKNPGFDALSIARAVYQDLQSGRIVSGASTITQQIVRSELLTDSRTFDRKAQEIALAYEIAKHYSKRQLLAYYLNSVPYGNLAIGAEAGSEVYFHHPVCSLDVAEAALLAGLPKAPSDYNPVLHRAAAMRRMRAVLTLMHKHGYMRTSAEVAAARAEAQYWHFSPPSLAIRYPQFVHYVIDTLKSMPNVNRQLYRGLDIYTTIDPGLQDLAQRTITRQIDSLKDKHVTDAALVSLDLRPRHYGWILTMVGSAHYGDASGQVNMAIKPRQPGSSMKPFNYIYAFEHGVGPGTQVLDLPIQLPDPNDIEHYGWYVPVNYDHQFRGQLTVRVALANSLNLPAVKVEYYVTSPMNVVRTALRYGMTSLYRDNPGLDCSVCYSVTLGGLLHGTRLLEETAAYGTFATGGVTVPPVAIWKIVQRNTGATIFCSADCPRSAKPASWLVQQRHRVLDPAHAYEMTDVLSDNSSRCTLQVCEFGLDNALVLSHPAAAKTGTTNAFTDNWTVGYTPQIVTGVWAGNADNSQMKNVIGVTGAAPIWHDFMEGAFSRLRLPSVPFVAPPNVFRTAQCTQPPAIKFTTPGYRSAPGVATAPTTPTTGYSAPDLYVAKDPVPLCRLPERGALPVTCANYPRPIPITFRCVYQTGAQYTNAYAYPQSYTYPSTGQGTFGQGNTDQGTFGQGTTGQGTFGQGTTGQQP